MAKVVTFLVPGRAPKTGDIVNQERQGVAALLYVGNIQERFVLQFAVGTTTPVHLTHWASGQKVGDLSRIKMRFARHSHITDRRAAELLIADVIAQVGADKLRESMAAAPVLNKASK